MRMFLILAGALALSGCMTSVQGDPEQIARGQLERRDAEQEAMRRCPTGSVEPRPARGEPAASRQGRSPIDYECKRPGS